MKGERQSFVPSEATLLDELRPGKITGAQYRRTGNDPIDLRPIPSEPAFLRVEKEPRNLSDRAQGSRSPVRHQAHKRRVSREFRATPGL
jgi:hypothetical protein